MSRLHNQALCCIAASRRVAITENTIIYCSGTYRYLDSSFKCERNHSKRRLNVRLAIKESCNTFFYECGKRLGYSKMNEYRTLLGLGQGKRELNSMRQTALWIAGIQGSVGETWQPGYNIQTAIGQGNLFTPIQLAVYCSTIANGGY
jgi:penicillin-binding protein 2